MHTTEGGTRVVEGVTPAESKSIDKIEKKREIERYKVDSSKM